MHRLLLLLVACDRNADPEVDDRRLDPADYPPPAGGEQWLGPDVTVEPGTEVQYCVFDTYDGPDMGMVSFDSYQGTGGHHLILLGTSAGTDVHPDGELIDCTRTGDIPMTDFEPLINAEPNGAGRSSIALPDTMAVKLRNGQRYVVQAHYVNTSTSPARFRDVMNVGLVEEAAVVTWAAAFALTEVDGIAVPPGASEISFDCTFPDDYDMLYLTGHMHEHGASFQLDSVIDSTVTNIYEIPVWDPQYRDAPPLAKFEPGETTWAAGTALRTTCRWDNTTDETLEFPAEMCATYGMLYPSLVPVVCVP